MKYLLLLFVSLFQITCKNTVNRASVTNSKSINISNIDVIIRQSDSLRKINDSLSVLSKYKEGELLYRGHYMNGQLNGAIDVYKGGKKYAFGIMEKNKPIGLFRFVDSQGKIDSILIYLKNGNIQKEDVNHFKFEKTVLNMRSGDYIIDKPIGWVNVMDSNTQKTIGIFNPSVETFLKPTIILNEYTTPRVLSFNETVIYMLELLERTYGKVTILSERYIQSKLETYYQMELEFYFRNIKCYYMTSIFPQLGGFKEVGCLSGNQSQTDYYLYSALFREIVFNITALKVSR